jgi:DNA-binding MarR family transcriptional regulator
VITRAQRLVLTRPHRRPGASHSEHAEMMEVEKATAGRMIARLVANGWVERRSEPGDKRVKRVYLTPEAERVHKRIWRVAEDTVETALADLSARESKQLFTLLQRVKETLVSGANGSAKGSAAIAGRNSASRGMRRPNGRIPS